MAITKLEEHVAELGATAAANQEALQQAHEQALQQKAEDESKPWIAAMRHWFAVRDVDDSGSFSLEEYVALAQKMWNVHKVAWGVETWDPSAHEAKFNAMDVNKVPLQLRLLLLPESCSATAAAAAAASKVALVLW